MTQFDLSGKTALVTGASSGFGRHFSQVLAAHGARVVLAARRTALLSAAVEEIRASGGTAQAISLDVSHAAKVEAALGALPAIDILVNNAGVAGQSRALDCEEAEWRWTFDVNVHASFFMARQAARKMMSAGGGSIINIASITGIRPGAGSAAYSSSKAAVIQMTRALAMEWARYGVRVNALAPGYFETDLNREFLRSEFGQAMKKRVPQRRFGAFHELDGPLLLLASDASSYMTGAVLDVDGGHLVSQL